MLVHPGRPRACYVAAAGRWTICTASAC